MATAGGARYVPPKRAGGAAAPPAGAGRLAAWTSSARTSSAPDAIVRSVVVSRVEERHDCCYADDIYIPLDIFPGGVRVLLGDELDVLVIEKKSGQNNWRATQLVRLRDTMYNIQINSVSLEQGACFCKSSNDGNDGRGIYLPLSVVAEFDADLPTAIGKGDVVDVRVFKRQTRTCEWTASVMFRHQSCCDRPITPPSQAPAAPRAPAVATPAAPDPANDQAAAPEQPEPEPAPESEPEQPAAPTGAAGWVTHPSGSFRYDPRPSSALGQGAQGTVHPAERCGGVGTWIPCVLKVERGISTRVRREVQAMADMEKDTDTDSQCHVLKYFGGGPMNDEPDDGVTYLLIERCDMDLLGALGKKLEGDPNLLAGDPKAICHQIAKGLKHIHELGWVHRDFKPANVLVNVLKDQNGDPKYIAKICDYGLAKRVNADASSMHPSGMQSGTTGWTAKEIMELRLSLNGKTEEQQRAVWDERMDAAGLRAADIWSCGCVMCYVAMGGVHPFAREQWDRDGNILRGRLPDLVRLHPLARDLLGAMLSHDPAARPTAQQTLNHPLFWPGEKKLRFISELRDFCGDGNYKQLHADIIEALDAELIAAGLQRERRWPETLLLPCALPPQGKAWVERDARKWGVEDRYDTYERIPTTKATWGLVVLIRDTSTGHWNTMGRPRFADAEETAAYFDRCFPELFLTAWSVMKRPAYAAALAEFKSDWTG